MAQTTGSGEELTCFRVEVKGIVQGVGFRPFVYNLAQKYGLKGWVYNSGRGVTIELEGPESMIREFLREIKNRPPRLAKITQIITGQRPPHGYTAFEIIQSSPVGEKDTLISPDVAACEDCRRGVDSVTVQLAAHCLRFIDRQLAGCLRPLTARRVIEVDEARITEVLRVGIVRLFDFRPWAIADVSHALPLLAEQQFSQYCSARRDVAQLFVQSCEWD
ncbi:MAG: acylphosphatase [Firmicutes bacterium]|nr:acylphosphatase [Bacillota bacterium]